MFLSDTKVKNFITCFKDPVFLKFFYSRIRPVRERESRYPPYRWVSPCGPETNYIEVDLLPIVWHKFERDAEGRLLLVDTSDTFRLPFQLGFQNCGWHSLVGTVIECVMWFVNSVIEPWISNPDISRRRCILTKMVIYSMPDRIKPAGLRWLSRPAWRRGYYWQQSTEFYLFLFFLR